MRRMVNVRDIWEEGDVLFLSQLGIEVKVGWQKFDLEESDERLVKIRNYFAEKKPRWRCDWPWIDYSREDMESAEYYVLAVNYACGYPCPENTYDEVIFDADKHCPKCKCGRIQVNDLRVKKVSKRHGFWGYISGIRDSLFVSRKIYEDIFAPYGIDKRTVTKGGKPVEDVYRLMIPVINESSDLSYMENRVCPVCGEVKYTPAVHRYPFFHFTGILSPASTRPGNILEKDGRYITRLFYPKTLPKS